MTTKLTKAKAILAILLGSIFLCCFIFASFRIHAQQSSAVPSTDAITTNEDRVAYLNSWGWEVDPSAVETLDILLPAALDASYQSYNDLQAEHGLDLSPYCGQRVKRYTYTVLNHPDHPSSVQANLYLYENTVVAGDIMAPGKGGFIASLHFPA